jgi:hypothetical protein
MDPGLRTSKRIRPPAHILYGGGGGIEDIGHALLSVPPLRRARPRLRERQGAEEEAGGGGRTTDHGRQIRSTSDQAACRESPMPNVSTDIHCPTPTPNPDPDGRR